jgi:hypothetical protein
MTLLERLADLAASGHGTPSSIVSWGSGEFRDNDVEQQDAFNAIVSKFVLTYHTEAYEEKQVGGYHQSYYLYYY